MRLQTSDFEFNLTNNTSSSRNAALMHSPPIENIMKSKPEIHRWQRQDYYAVWISIKSPRKYLWSSSYQVAKLQERERERESKKITDIVKFKVKSLLPLSMRQFFLHQSDDDRSSRAVTYQVHSIDFSDVNVLLPALLSLFQNQSALVLDIWMEETKSVTIWNREGS